MKAYLGILGIHETLKFANFIKNIARHTWENLHILHKTKARHTCHTWGFDICIFYTKPKLGILGILRDLKFANFT